MAVTLRNQARQLLRTMKSILDNKELPALLRKEIDDVEQALKRTWPDLGAEASIDGAFEPQTAAESAEGANMLQEIIKQEDGKWVLYSADGSKKLGTFDTEEEAIKREKQIQFFKHQEQAAGDALVSQAVGATTHVLKESGEALVEQGNVQALIDAFSDWAGGSVEECVTHLEGKEGIDNPGALCAWMKDRAMGPAWRSEPRGAAATESAIVEALVTEALAESETGRVLGLREFGDGGPLLIRAELIQPGWGNERDNHYYSKELLARDAGKFVKTMMHESNHREGEKSTRTWVSTIDAIDGFSETGAPIGLISIHDPDFAQRVRNLAARDNLGLLPCSINASGAARSGEVGGRKGKMVEAITGVHSVDWVTKAGAGGHAVGLVEAAAVPEPVPDPELVDAQEAALEPVTINEGIKPELLATERAATLLRESGLPRVVADALAVATYRDEVHVAEAVDAARRVMKAAGAGAVRGLGPPGSVVPARDAPLREREFDILKRFGI